MFHIFFELIDTLCFLSRPHYGVYRHRLWYGGPLSWVNRLETLQAAVISLQRAEEMRTRRHYSFKTLMLSSNLRVQVGSFYLILLVKKMCTLASFQTAHVIQLYPGPEHREVDFKLRYYYN